MSEIGGLINNKIGFKKFSDTFMIISSLINSRFSSKFLLFTNLEKFKTSYIKDRIRK